MTPKRKKLWVSGIILCSWLEKIHWNKNLDQGKENKTCNLIPLMKISIVLETTHCNLVFFWPIRVEVANALVNLLHQTCRTTIHHIF